MKKNEKLTEKYREISSLLDDFVHSIEKVKKNHEPLLNLMNKALEAFNALKEKAQFEPALKNSLTKIEQSISTLNHTIRSLPIDVIQHSVDLKNNLWQL